MRVKGTIWAFAILLVLASSVGAGLPPLGEHAIVPVVTPWSGEPSRTVEPTATSFAP